MTKRLSVAMVTDSIQPFNAGGKEVRYAQLSRELSSQFDVRVFTMQWWSGGRDTIENDVPVRAVCPRVALYKGGRRSILQAIIFAAGCARLAGERFDVIEADHMPYLQLFVLRLVAWTKRARLVVTWHEVWGRSYWTSYLGPLGLLAYAVEASAMRLPDAILAASEQTAGRLRSILGDRASITVAPNGVDLDAIRSTVPLGPKVDVVTVGRLMPHKRVDLLFEAVSIVRRERGRDLTVRVIGQGTAERSLREAAHELGIADLVEFRTDVRDNTEVYALIKSAGLFVLASEREGFGIVALEAIACGLPVVTTTAPDNLTQHLVEQVPTGLVCAPDARSLADAIVTAMEGPVQDSTQLAEVEKWLTSYSWPVIAQSVARVLDPPSR